MENPPKRQKTETYTYPDLYSTKYSLEKQHSGAINAVKISPDGTRLASCSADATIKVFSLSDGSLLSMLSGHTKGISDVAFLPINSDIIASCSDDLSIRIWSLSKQKCLRILKKHTYHVTVIRFTTKGNILVSGSADETITIWDLSNGKTLKTLAAHLDPVSSLSITPDNTIIVSASFDGLMRLFDLELGQCLKTLVYNSASHGTATASTSDVVNFPISNVEILPNGKYILSSSLDGKLRLWDYMDSRVLKTYLGVDNGPVSELFNCGVRFITATKRPLIASGSDSSGLLFWDVQTKEIVHRQEFSAPVMSVDVLHGGKEIVACTRDGIIRVFSLGEGFVEENRENGEKSVLKEEEEVTENGAENAAEISIEHEEENGIENGKVEQGTEE